MLHSINLLPWREAQKQAHRQRFIHISLLAVSFAVAMQWAAGWYVDDQATRQRSRVDFLNQHIVDLDRQINSLKRVEKAYQDLMVRFDMVESLQKKRNKTTQFMDLIPHLIPQGVYVDQMSMNDHNIELKGISDSTARLATMLDLLENSSYISDVEMHSIVSGSYRFGKQFQSFQVSFSFHMEAKDIAPLQEVTNG
ncbi:PilN domain-containing protein [Vibrio sp. Y2-5]|uniref:PilN domain-containing protein n=1 Tax=Vibrio sp. Y2-5 TaxID=2743977 RepID=UPI00166046E6|nr:PilN domain-containing protein [Vibrio sp. Y2-5]MBD0787690.1 PilN domain-containing protein [Vibrio sp. Y2-5]